jgi:hypothetical protein
LWKREIFMKYLSKYVNYILLLSFIFISSLSLVASPVFADTPLNGQGDSANNQNTVSQVPLEITPECSDGANASAYWQVNNKNTSDVNLTWTNIDNGHTGTFIAIPGLSQLTTYFDNTDPNNTTQFIYQGNTTQTNATEAACATPAQPTQPPAPTCVDGSIQQNLSIDWVSPGEVTVQTVNDAPLCNNVSIDFSSYIMPAYYNGQPFFTTYDQNNPANNVANPTAFPQTIYDNQSATLSAGTDGLTTLNVNLPNSCNNVQVDVYYAPEQTVIGAQGNGTSNIASQIYPSAESCINTNPSGPVSGTNPGGPTTGTSPTSGGKGGGNDSTTTTTGTVVNSSSPVTAAKVSTLLSTTNSPATLAYTGESPIAPYLIAIALLGITSTVVYSVRKDSL